VRAAVSLASPALGQTSSFAVGLGCDFYGYTSQPGPSCVASTAFGDKLFANVETQLDQ
jgi:hypothetical protein